MSTRSRSAALALVLAVLAFGLVLVMPWEQGSRQIEAPLESGPVASGTLTGMADPSAAPVPAFDGSAPVANSTIPAAPIHAATDPAASALALNTKGQPETQGAGPNSLLINILNSLHDPVPDVWVTLNSKRVSYRALTGILGEVVFSGLHEGTYTCTIQAPGRRALTSGRPVTLGKQEDKILTLWLGSADLTISGRVLDYDGEPVPWAEVVAKRRPGRSAGELVPAGDVRALEAFTDMDGGYEITGLEEGEYYLRTFDTEDFPAVSIVAQAGSDNADLILPDRLELAVYGTVTDGAGVRLAGVQVLSVHEPEQIATTGANGSYKLDLWRVREDQGVMLQFSADGYNSTKRASRIPVNTTVGEIRLDAQLKALPETLVKLSGLLISEHGLVAGGRVSLYSAELGRSFQATSRSEGEFSLAVAIAQDYRLSVSSSGRYQDYIEEPIQLKASKEFLEVWLDPLEKGRLTGSVVDVRGRPLANVYLLVGSDRARSSYQQVVSDRFGRFRIEQAPEGSLNFRAPGNHISGVSLEPGESVDVELVLDLGDRTLDGFVTDDGGYALGGALVQLSWRHQSAGLHSSSARSTTTDAEGYFRFTQLGPGSHNLDIRATNYIAEYLTVEMERGIDIRLHPASH